MRKDIASTGNRTRAARVAGEHSTTEPSMLVWFLSPKCATETIQIMKYEKMSLRRLKLNSLSLEGVLHSGPALPLFSPADLSLCGAIG